LLFRRHQAAPFIQLRALGVTINKSHEQRHDETCLQEYFTAFAPKTDPPSLLKRSINALTRHNVVSMEQLCELSEKELCCVRNGGTG
jgi:DNA-directed RNA polymerase alpha subunit